MLLLRGIQGLPLRRRVGESVKIREGITAGSSGKRLGTGCITWLNRKVKSCLLA